MKRLLRVSTVPLSLKMFCKDLLIELSDQYETLAISSPGPELDELSDCGIPVEEVAMQRSISIKSDIVSLWRLIGAIRRFKPDIVHSITPKAGLLCMIAARIAGVPVRIHSFTGLLFTTAKGLKRLILKTTDRITCACATHILPEGHGVRNDLVNAHITSKPLNVLGNGNLRGIDLEYYQLTPEVINKGKSISEVYGIKVDDFVFVFVGRVVGDKGINELVKAFSRLNAEIDNIHLLLIGPQEKESDPLNEDTLNNIANNKKIHFTDKWVDDVRPYYAISDALAFPSYREGFPNVVLEAGAMSLPSIVTDINGSREIITNGLNGDIIPTHDSEALYHMMKKYVSDRNYINKIKNNCRPLIEQKFDAKYVRKCLIDFYNSL